MEALFHIGKDLGACEARVQALESKRCSCGGRRRGRASDADLPAEQRRTLAEIREKHATIVAGFNGV